MSCVIPWGWDLSPPRAPVSAVFVLGGKLARHLRMPGFDCRNRNDDNDSQPIELARAKRLIILHRDRGILKQAKVQQGCLIRSSMPERPVVEVLERYRLRRLICPLYRCPKCNGLLRPVHKEEIIHRLLPKTALYYLYFRQCQCCRQLYWQGSHYAKVEHWIHGLMAVREP